MLERKRIGAFQSLLQPALQQYFLVGWHFYAIGFIDELADFLKISIGHFNNVAIGEPSTATLGNRGQE